MLIFNDLFQKCALYIRDKQVKYLFFVSIFDRYGYWKKFWIWFFKFFALFTIFFTTLKISVGKESGYACPKKCNSRGFKNIFKIEITFKKFIEETVWKRLKHYYKAESFVLVSKRKQYSLTDPERTCLGSSPKCYQYQKIFIQGFRFTHTCIQSINGHWRWFKFLALW